MLSILYSGSRNITILFTRSFSRRLSPCLRSFCQVESGFQLPSFFLHFICIFSKIFLARAGQMDIYGQFPTYFRLANDGLGFGPVNGS
jgi:hypothetical protein